MIHYTVVPFETVWDGYEQLGNKQYKEIQIGHMTMVLDQVNPSEAQIIRLISPNPYDYLNPLYAPGRRIGLHPQFES